MKSVILPILALLICTAFSVRKEDIVSGPPGMKNTTVYSGYLDTYHNDRKLHYVFVQSQSNPDTAPLTIWLNGGPGCSSLIGYLQEIGPYLVGDTYKFGDDLIKNPYRWNRASNVLFIEAPGYVGFSTDKNPNITYSDKQTADDNFEAIKDFLWKIAPEFTNRSLYISGESYAGKYVPDIAVRIINHNRQQNATYINLKGLLIGNPIMNHADNSLQKNRIQFMIDQNFISERLLAVYTSACQIDFFSPRCEYFKYQFQKIRQNLNYHNVFEVCVKGQTQDMVTQAFLKKVSQKLKQMDKQKKYGPNPEKADKKYNKIQLSQIPKCPIDDGLIDYLNYYQAIYHVDHVNKTWAPCDYDTPYDITVEASMQEFRQIFLNKGIKVWLFSGDWDDVVPYPDTVYHLNELRRKKQGNQEPWFVGETHAGFYQLYDSLTLITVKGSGHWVPIFKPAASYQMFYNFINDKPINNPVAMEEQQ